MKQRSKYFFVTAYLLALLALTGCSSSISIKANADKSASMHFFMDLGNTLSETIRMVSQSLGQGEGITEDTPIFSSALIQEAFSNSDFTDVEIKTPATSSLDIKGKVPAPEKQQSTLMTSTAKAANFVTCTATSLTVILAPETIQEVITSMPGNLSAYADLLMAPVFTGELMSTTEYRELIATVYGEEIASVMDKAEVKITLEPPEGKNIKRASLSTTERSRTSATKAVFTIPMIEFFTLSSPKTFSITF